MDGEVLSWHSRILAEAISIYEFQLELTILILGSKYVQKGYFQTKREIGNIEIEFSIFESV